MTSPYAAMLYEALARADVPTHLHEGLVCYLADRIRPGRFLTAVLSNDLSTAIACGDPESLIGLVGLARFLWNNAPSEAWGSPDHVAAWVEQAGHEETRHA